MTGLRRWASGRVSVLALIGLCLLMAGAGPVIASAPELAGCTAFIPAIAASVCSVRQTAVVSALVFTATTVTVTSDDEVKPLVALALVLFSLVTGLVAVYVSHRRITTAEARFRLRSAATAMQYHLLRALPHVTRDATLTGVYEPLRQENLVGGDVYDVAETPYATRVLVADVQGKGLAALGTSFSVVGAFRENAHREQDLLGLVDSLEQAVVRQNDYAGEVGEPERFVTGLVLDLNPDGTVRLVNCGHPQPYLVGPAAPPRSLAAGTDVPLGLGDLTGEPREVHTFSLGPDETLLLYTDGLDEGRAPDGTFFPLETRLGGLAPVPPAQMAETLYRQLHAFTDGRAHDDITILTLHRGRTAPRPGLAADGSAEG